MTDPRGPKWRECYDPHECNYPGCEAQVAGDLWGCRDHWMELPVELRDKYLGASRKRDRDRAAKRIATYLEIMI